MKNIEVDDIVWITYHNGKVYSGVVKEVKNSQKEGDIVTVLTQECGFRTVPYESCSFTKPPSVRRSKS